MYKHYEMGDFFKSMPANILEINYVFFYSKIPVLRVEFVFLKIIQ